ncbi:hypothetical protein R3P38DRAFT_2903929, partial [Favolaschia claudopus]
MSSWAYACRQDLQGSSSPATQLRSVHTIGAMYQRILPVAQDHPMCTQLTPRSTQFFLDVATGNFSTAVQNGIASGCLHLSGSDEKRDLPGQFLYVRVPSPISSSPDSTPIACTWRYIRAYPADLAWGVGVLLALGETVDVIIRGLQNLTMDLQLDNRVSIPLSTLIHELAASYPKIAGYPLYFGVTEDQTPNDRLKQDLAKKGSRYTNWANTNKGYIDWAPYHIPDCASLLSSGLRIDNNASGDEVWCITIPGPFTLNHAVGGFFPQFVPSAPVSAILSNLRPSLRSIFGTNVDEESTALVTAFLIDQRKYLRDHIVSDTISRESFSSVVRNGPAVFRRCKGGIPGIRILEIITLEGLVGRRGDEVVGGLWDVNTGPALKVFRHIMAMIEPLIPADGDLTSDVIARYIGPTLDLWPLTPKPHSFWHHCLWLSRTMIATGVIITSSWSEVVNAAIGGGYLGLVWRSIPDELRTEVLAGNTPLELEDFLPPLSARFWTPRPPTIHEYIRRLGCLFIVQHGPSPFHIHLNVPCLHAGGIKHDAAQAYCMFTIIMHSESVYRVALAEVKLMEEEGLVLRRSSSEETWAYFLKLKSSRGRRHICAQSRSHKFRARPNPPITESLVSRTH